MLEFNQQDEVLRIWKLIEDAYAGGAGSLTKAIVKVQLKVVKWGLVAVDRTLQQM